MEATEEERERLRREVDLPTVVPASNRRNLEEEGEPEAVPLKQRNPRWVHVWPQVLASCIALSLTIHPGISLSLSATLIPKLENDTYIKNFTQEQASWIVSIFAIGTPIGAGISGLLMEFLGRKRVCILTTIPIMLSWILVYITKETVTPLYISRALAGLGGGMTTVSLIYTAEISHMLYRPMLLCLNSVFVAFGIMVSNILGVYMEWRDLGIVFGLLSAASFSLCLILPESPYWLVNFNPSRARTSLAMEELRKLNRPSWLFEQESIRLKESLQARIDECGSVQTYEKKGIIARIQNVITTIKSRSILSPFCFLIVLFLLQQLSGVYIIIAYTTQFFPDLGQEFRKSIDEFTVTVILGVLRFVMSLVAAGLARIYGRRVLMITSSLGMGICSLVAGIMLTIAPGNKSLFGVPSPSGATNSSLIHSTDLNANLTIPINVDIEPEGAHILNIIALISILLFVCAGAIGHLVIPWTLIGELLPTKARAIGSGVIICTAYLFMFLNNKYFYFLRNHFDLNAFFFSYCTVSFLSVVYVYIFLPETLGKSFAQIARSFEKKNPNR